MALVGTGWKHQGKKHPTSSSLEREEVRRALQGQVSTSQCVMRSVGNRRSPASQLGATSSICDTNVHCLALEGLRLCVGRVTQCLILVT